MELSIFLAKVFGLYMLIVGIAILKNPNLQAVTNELSKDKDVRFVLGLFTLIMGILLVVSHNVWYGGYKIIITIISWIVFLKGVSAVWMSEERFKKLVSKVNTPSMLTAAGVVNLVLGLYLAYIGFFI